MLTSTLQWTEVQTEDRLQDSQLLPGVDVDAVKLSDPLRPNSSKTLLQLTHTQLLTQQAPALTHTQITAPLRVRANELVGGWGGQEDEGERDQEEEEGKEKPEKGREQ